MLYNTHRAAGARALEAEHFHPLGGGGRRDNVSRIPLRGPQAWKMLKEVFVDNYHGGRRKRGG